MNKNEKLKPCPFCGGEVDFSAPDNLMAQVYCPNCDNHTLWSMYAREKWNKRTRKDTRLKPCPICGNKGRVRQMHDGSWGIQCMKCFVTTKYSQNPDEAINAWNRRPENDQG